MTPALQTVPAARGCGTAWPLLQSPNWFEPMQTTLPLVWQGTLLPLATLALGEPVEPEA